MMARRGVGFPGRVVLLLGLAWLLQVGCARVAEAPNKAAVEATVTSDGGQCQPTAPDALGPFYVAGAPERNQVGEGYVLRGVVRSAVDCAPIAGARIEFWLAGPDGVYGDDYRATWFADADGAYRFESHVPPSYEGRPPHIHLLVSAPGYAELVTQHYPAGGAAAGLMDLVLVPGR